MPDTIQYQLVPMEDNHIVRQIADLDKIIFPHERPYGVDGLRAYYSSQYSYVMQDEDGIVQAYLFSKPQASEIFIGNLGVAEHARKNGCAKKLLNYLIAQAESENKTISLRVKSDNHPAISLYQRFGFVRSSGEGEAEFFYMTRKPCYQNKKIMWIAPRTQLEVIKAKVPGGDKNKQFIFINADEDILGQLPEYQADHDYQLILSGGHGDFLGGQPTQLIGKSRRTVEQWVGALAQKGFQFQNILLHACLSAGFFPIFSRLSKPEGLIFGHFLTATTDALPILDNPLGLLGNFREHYFADMEKRINFRDELGNLPFISDVIYQALTKIMFILNPQDLERALKEVNDAIHRGPGVDNLIDYNGLIQFLAENYIEFNKESETLCDIYEKISSFEDESGHQDHKGTDAPLKDEEEMVTDSEEKVKQNVLKSTQKLHSFFSQPANCINIGIGASGMIAGLTLICLGSGIIGAAILAAALSISIIITILCVTKPEMMYKV